MTDCTHTYIRLDFDGKEVQVPWARIFCPDCGPVSYTHLTLPTNREV